MSSILCSPSSLYGYPVVQAVHTRAYTWRLVGCGGGGGSAAVVAFISPQFEPITADKACAGVNKLVTEELNEMRCMDVACVCCWCP